MGFMDYQAPQQVNWQGATNSLMQLAQLQDQREMNALKKDQIKRENDKEDKSNALAEQYGSEKDETKKGDIFKQMVAIDPKRAESMYNTFSKMDENAYIKTQREAEQLGKVAFGVIQDPTMMDKMFPTLPKSSQEQLLKMGYDPSTPMDENKAKLVQGIGQHFINMAQDTKTLADHAFRKKEAKDKREFESKENALTRENQREVANIGASATLRGHQMSADASRYATDTNAELYRNHFKGNNSPTDKHNYEAMTEKAYGVDWFKMTPQQKMDAIDRTRKSYEQGGYASGTEAKDQRGDNSTYLKNLYGR